MMTIAEKILRAKADYDEVFEAGKMSVESSVKFTEVDSTSYRTTAPNNVLPFAKVNKIGGMTHKTRNLIPPATRKTYTSNGITYTVNDDGSIVANGTATAESNFEIQLTWKGEKISLVKGKTYTLSAGVSSPSNTTYRLIVQDNTYHQAADSGSSFVANDTDYYAFIRIYSGYVANNLTFYPMLNEGTTALPFETYFEGMRNAEVTELKSHGVNYLDISAVLNDAFVDNGDGTYSVITDATSNRFSKEIPLDIPIGQSVVICGESVEGAIVYGKVGNDTQWQPTFFFNGNGYIRKSTAENPITKVIFYIDNPDRGKTTKFKNPMIALGETKVPYKAYVGNIDTLPLPEAVKSLDGYGLGVNSEYYNYIDFERKVFVQRVKAVDMGTLAWSYRVSNNRHIFATGSLADEIQGQISQFVPINALAADYRAVTVASTWVDRDMAYNSARVGNQSIEFVDNRYTDAATFKNAVIGKLLIFALETPIETDISAYLTDEYIEVEGGGTVTVVNEHQLDAPTTISYIGEI